jgi:uncharacterized protein YjdB
MRTVSLLRLLPALSLLAVLSACDSESIGPATAGVGTITVIPRTATIGAGQAVQLTAQLVDEFGDPLDARVSWSSSNPEVATVSVSGTVIGRKEGRAAITASAHGKLQAAAVHVIRDDSVGKPKPQL